MTRVVPFLLVAFFIVGMTISCAPPEEKMVRHLSRVAQILEENQDRPDEAGDKLIGYLRDNIDEIKRVAEELDAKDKKVSGAEKNKYHERWNHEIRPIMEKIQRLMKNEKLSTNPKVIEAFKDLGEIIAR